MGNFYGHKNTMMDLARAFAPHKTGCCRDPMVAVVPRDTSSKPHAFIRAVGYRSLPRAVEVGWPDHHPAAATIVRTGVASGGFTCSRAVLLAALRWPKWYEFIEPTEEEDGQLPNYATVVRQNQGVVTHMIGEAVMPALAEAIMQSAASAAARTAAPPIRALVDVCCCLEEMVDCCSHFLLGHHGIVKGMHETAILHQASRAIQLLVLPPRLQCERRRYEKRR